MADSASPSSSPSSSPSRSPSDSPSASPSSSPSKSPSRSPSASPSASPSPIAATEIAYTLRERIRLGKKHVAFVKLEFGGTDNDLYTTGGLPLTTNKLGMDSTVDAVIILESNANALLYEWDKSENTLRIFSEARVEQTGNVTVVASTALELLVIGW